VLCHESLAKWLGFVLFIELKAQGMVKSEHSLKRNKFFKPRLIQIPPNVLKLLLGPVVEAFAKLIKARYNGQLRCGERIFYSTGKTVEEI
jgi:hypothetical protein